MPKDTIDSLVSYVYFTEGITEADIHSRLTLFLEDELSQNNKSIYKAWKEDVRSLVKAVNPDRKSISWKALAYNEAINDVLNLLD